MRLSIRNMSAGNMVYGLYRINALERAGVYRHVLVPDRLLFTELSLYGQFKQVPQVLWFRRWYGRIFSLGRQRAASFPRAGRSTRMRRGGSVHGVSLFWTFTVRGQGRPEISVRRALPPPCSASCLPVCCTSGRRFAPSVSGSGTARGPAPARAAPPPDASLHRPAGRG